MAILTWEPELLPAAMIAFDTFRIFISPIPMAPRNGVRTRESLIDTVISPSSMEKVTSSLLSILDLLCW